MPWLDLGELPLSYNSSKSEAFQVYMIPRDELPFNLVIPYENWPNKYDDRKARAFYHKTQLSDKGIAFEDVQDTLQQASTLISGYRGYLAKRNKIVKIALALTGLIFCIIAVVVGMESDGNYWAPMLIVVAYLLIVLGVTMLFKYRSSYQMRISQFLLSVFCRAENNRLYLKKGVEVRPGFLGKWIEFTCLESAETDEIIQKLRQRFLKPALEQKAAAFDKQIMGQQDLMREQRDIEKQIHRDMSEQREMRDMQEQAEVAAARLESNPNDFS